MKRAQDPKNFTASQRKNIKTATQQNALDVQSSIRKRMKRGVSPRNKALTVLIKGSSKPLIGLDNQLFQGIAIVNVNFRRAFVGVRKVDDVFDIAETLHEGREIGVSDKMRGLFFLLWLASIGRVKPETLTGRAAELFDRFQEWKPLRPETRLIRIPSRPWIRQTFDESALRDRVFRRWAKASQRSLDQGAR